MRIPSEVVIKARSLRMGNGVSVLPSCLSRRLRARAQARRRFAHVSRLRKPRYRDSGRPFAQRCRPACLLRIGRSAGLAGNTARIFGYFFNWYICSCILSP